MQHPFSFYAALCCFIALFVGCSQDGSVRTHAVNGTIRWNDQPAVGATVIFVPQEEGGVQAFGMTDQQGNYRLTSPGRNIGTGAVSGSYKVTVKLDPGVPVDHPSKASLLPIVYAEAATTPLKADVVAGKNVFDFTLEGVAPKGVPTPSPSDPTP